MTNTTKLRIAIAIATGIALPTAIIYDHYVALILLACMIGSSIKEKEVTNDQEKDR